MSDTCRCCGADDCRCCPGCGAGYYDDDDPADAEEHRRGLVVMLAELSLEAG